MLALSPGMSWNRVISGRRPRSLGAHEWSWDRLPCSAQFSKTNVALGWGRLRDVERVHLFDLARRGAATAPPAERNEPSTVRASLRRLVESSSFGGTGGVLDGFDDRSVVDDFTRHLGPRLIRLLSEYLMRNSL